MRYFLKADTTLFWTDLSLNLAPMEGLVKLVKHVGEQDPGSARCCRTTSPAIIGSRLQPAGGGIDADDVAIAL